MVWNELDQGHIVVDEVKIFPKPGEGTVPHFRFLFSCRSYEPKLR